ncbi:hypothetical protein [Streptomyces sp. NPDC055681]
MNRTPDYGRSPSRTPMAPGRITLVVTHRLDNVRMADRILVLDRGRIREEGTFDQLAYGDGLFSELYALSQDR